MAIDLLTWTFAGAFAACAIAVVYLVMAYIRPIMTSPGKYFVKAKKDRKPLVIADSGKFFRFILGDDKIGQERNQVITNGVTDMIKIPPTGGMKFAEGGILMGIADDFRSTVVNVAILNLMQEINRKGWDMDKVNQLLTDLTNNLKIDLGYVDGGETIRERYERDIAQINAHYDAAIKRVRKVNPEDQGPVQGDGVNIESTEEGDDDGDTADAIEV